MGGLPINPRTVVGMGPAQMHRLLVQCENPEAIKIAGSELVLRVATLEGRQAREPTEYRAQRIACYREMFTGMFKPKVALIAAKHQADAEMLAAALAIAEQGL